MTLIVKLGGEVASGPDTPTVAAGIRALVATHRVAIVHGGGPQATSLASHLGLPTRQVAGRRITDAATLDVIKMAVAGKVNVDLCAALLAAGVSPVGLHGASALTIRATKQPPQHSHDIDLGLVGDVIGINHSLLDLLWSANHVPVLACLGADASGAVYNINADAVASQLASALHADRMLLVTATSGVLRDLTDPRSRIPSLTPSEALRALADGTVSGGMIAKLEEALAALSRGVRSIHILGPADLAHALDSPSSVGTTLADRPS